MSKVKAKKSAFIVGLIMLAATIGLPAAAQAGNSQYCSGAWVCVYKHKNFDVGLGYRSTSFSLQNISAANENEVSSWENRRGTNARWYTGKDGSGKCYTMTKYSENAQLNYFTQNDKMSSWAGNRGC